MHGDSQILSDCEAGVKFVMAKRITNTRGVPFEWLTLLPSEYSHAGWPVVVKKRRGITFLIDKLHL